MLSFTPVLVDGDSTIQQAFLSGRCDAHVSDGSQIAGFRFQQGPRAAELTILPERISSEPSGAAVRKGDGRNGTVPGGPGDVVSVPTWIFRGFSNTGDEDGWIFTALCGGDTGGIIWHPSILENAARYGMFPTRDDMLVDTAAGTAQPAPTP